MRRGPDIPPLSVPGRALLCALALSVLLAVLPAPLAAGSDSPEARYRSAAARFHGLRSAPQATAAQWQAVGDAFRAIHAQEPSGQRGPDALYSAALSYQQAHRVGGQWRDLSRAVANFRDFVTQYGGHRLADDALMHLADRLADGYNDLPAAREAYRRVIAEFSQGDQHPAARKRLQAIEDRIARAAQEEPAPAVRAALRAREAATAQGAAMAPGAAPGRVKRIQHWTTLEWTRVIITLEPSARYEAARLPAEGGTPERVYLDLRGVVPDEALAAITVVDDAVLQRVRVSRFDERTTRVVLDLRASARHAVQHFGLPTEQKIVVDLHPPPQLLAELRRKAEAAAPGTRAAPGTPRVAADRPAPQGAPAAPRVTLPSALGLKVGSVMIDPGHGGHDPGAVGYGVEEKDLALRISKRLRVLLRRRHPELRVGLTREDDVFIPLEERPRLAKQFGADLFVSVHLNANEIRRFHGVETYFLNLTSDADALKVAARENATTEKRVSDLNAILVDLLRDTNIVESSTLAKSVHASLVGALRARHRSVKDLGVKQAPFLVLMGAEMPSVLVEAGFLTNRGENRRLRDPSYLERIAEGIYEGLRSYIEQQAIIAADRANGSLAVNVRR